MASLIVCTPGGASDNCYITLADANAYFANTLRNATWTSASYTDTQREQALIQATQQLEQLGGARPVDSPSRACFWGEPYDESTPQALHFPRTTDVTIGGEVEVPQAVQQAVCEQALFCLQALTATDLIDHAQMQANNVQSFSVDGLSVTYSRKTPADVPDDIAPQAWALMKTYIRRGFGTAV